MLYKRMSTFNHGNEISGEKGSSIRAVIDRDKLAGALAAVTAAQADGDVGWVQFQFGGEGQVVVSALSHNLSIRYSFAAEYEGQGILKVSGKQLSEYVRQLPPEKITLIAELPQRLLVQDQTQTDVVVPQEGTSIVVKGDYLERWVNAFRDFVSTDDTRFYANGALIWADTSQGLNLQAVASDAYRLAKAQLKDGLRSERVEDSAVLVPKKALDELRRLCAANPEMDYRLRWHGERLFFAVETENYVMVSKCIPGKYPPYTSAIPQKVNFTVNIGLSPLLESVKRVLLFADKNRIIKLGFDGPVLDVQSFTPGLKEGEEVVELAAPVEQPFVVNYNGTLLTGILNVLSGASLKFSWENVNRPVMITGEAEKGLDVFYLLVPTRF